MTQIFRALSVGLCCVGAVLTTGCFGPGVPDIVPAGGIVTINGTPLANVEVRFVPQHPGLDGNYVAKGVSDADGKFNLVLPGKTESGVCACAHRVIVLEGPMPDEAYGQSEAAQMLALKFMATLKDRPLPKIYESLSESPLLITVVPDQREYKLELTR